MPQARQRLPRLFQRIGDHAAVPAGSGIPAANRR